MKMTRKLIPAFVMLLVSAILLSTASYAWFASNFTVKATDMNVKVKSNARFLQISADGTNFSESADATNKNTNTNGGIELIYAAITVVDDAANTFAWKTGTSKSESNHTDGAALTDFEGDIEAGTHALYNTFYVKLAEGSQGNLTNFKVESVTVEGEADDLIRRCLRILVVGTDGIQLYSLTGTGTPTLVTASSDEYLIQTVTTTAASFEVYIYFDGEDAEAKTVNLPETILDYDVTINFAAQQ
ncbi:MAG: hypothetical protein IKA06_06405 [Clostridia bacterium]|nr:hypothetical protein [Clostridia bacterium]